LSGVTRVSAPPTSRGASGRWGWGRCRRAAVGAGAPRRGARGGRAGAAVGGAGAHVVRIELRGAAGRARGAGGAALAEPAGAGRVRRRDPDRGRAARGGAGATRPAPELVLRRRLGVERPREADPRRPGDGGRPPDRRLRLGLVLREV